MRKIALIAILQLLLLFSSCASQKKEEILPLSEVKSILYDIYLTTGLLEFEDIRAIYSSKDSISIYFDIYTAHGYSRELVENSMKYYFIKKTNKVTNIYNQILSDMETEIANIRQAAAADLDSIAQ